jgi:hypothetical protein
MVDGWVYKPGVDASDALVEKILAGAQISEFIKKRILQYLDALD